MWYFAWILGVLFACACGIITALTIECLNNTYTKNNNSK